MWTPAAALLWESWRLARRRMGILMLIATLGGAALLASSMSRDESIRLVVALAYFAALFSQLPMIVPDHRKGFALTLGYTRPIPTWTLVAVPLAFVGMSAAVTYLVPTVVLRGLFGVPLPLLPIVAPCATTALVWVASQWWTSDRVVRGVFGISLFLVLSQVAVRSPTLSRIASLPAIGYLGMGLLSAVALVVAVAGVARQRRGDDRVLFRPRRAVQSETHAGGGVTARIGDRLRLRCPVSSATLAQLWFEVHTLGGRIARSGVVLGLLAVVLLSLRGAVGVSTEGLVSYMLLATTLPLFVALPSVLGLRRKPGHAYMGGFAGTLPLGTTRLVWLKVLVASLALFIAWGFIAASLWIVVQWLDGSNPDLRHVLAEYVPDLPGGVAGMAAAALVPVYVIALLAIAAALHALLVLNGKRFLLCALGITLYGTAIVVMVVRGWLDGDLIFELHLAAFAGAFILGIAFLLRRGLADRIVSTRSIGAVVASGLAFALATREMNSEWLNPGGKGLEEWVAGFLIGLLPLAAVALLPWSFSRLRHR